MTPFTKWMRALQLVIIGAALAVGAGFAGLAWLKLPEHDHRLVLPPLTQAEEQLASELQNDTKHLAVGIGPRNVAFHLDGLEAAGSYIEQQWVALGLTVVRQAVPSPFGPSDNLMVEIPGRNPDRPAIVIGAHYDTFAHSPGADDNASGVAALLALSRRFLRAELNWPIRMVAFTNEEPPVFQTPAMGSVYFVDHLAPASVALAIVFDSIGFYSSQSGTQRYPWPLDSLYDDTGDFIGIVGDLGSRAAARRILEGFRRHSHFPAGAITMPEFVEGTGWSDHWAFWRKKIPAVMLTDSAFYRYDYYHTREDKMERLDFRAIARVVSGLEAALRDPAFDPIVPYRFTGR